MKLIKVSTVNSKAVDSPKSFTKLIFPESKLINQIAKRCFKNEIRLRGSYQTQFDKTDGIR